jgi:hypothetical protein
MMSQHTSSEFEIWWLEVKADYGMIFCNCSKPEQLQFANPMEIAVGDGICSHLNHVLTVSAASASTWPEYLQKQRKSICTRF